MTAQPIGRPAVGRARAIWASVRLVLALGLVFVLCSIAFLRDRNMPRRPSGQPAAWKLWLWCTIFVGLFGLVVAVSPHWAVYRPPGMPRGPRP